MAAQQALGMIETKGLVASAASIDATKPFVFSCKIKKAA